MPHASPRTGWSLTETVVVVAVASILAVVMVPALGGESERDRDARRVADLHALQRAIEAFHADRGHYPAAEHDPLHDGWDASHARGFVEELVREGYLPAPVVDPLNTDAHHYRYFVYSEGAYGCVCAGPFYVVGLTRFESAEFEREAARSLACRGRDWSQLFAFCLGGGADFRTR